MVLELSDDEIEEGSFDVFRDEEGEGRVECWTDGTWIRLGPDVEEGRCLEFRIGEFDLVEEYVRNRGGAQKVSLTSKSGGVNIFYVLHSTDTFIQKDREVVLELGTDGFPLYDAKGLSKEERDDLNAEELARSFVQALRPLDYIEECNRLGLSSRVDVVILRDEARFVNLNLVETLKESDPIESDSVSVSVEGLDGGLAERKYKFTVDVSRITGSSIEEQEPDIEEEAERLEEHFSGEMEWPQFFVSGEDVEDFTTAYYRVDGPNGPVVFRNPGVEGEVVTTMFSFAMEANSGSFRQCSRGETPWVDEEDS